MKRWSLLEGKVGVYAVGLGAYALALIATALAALVDAGPRGASDELFALCVLAHSAARGQGL